VAIAALALGLTIWSGRETRQHNRLSMRPDLRLNTRFNTGGGGGWSVRNNGVGSAVVEWFRLFVDGNRVQSYCDLTRVLDLPENLPRRSSVEYPGAVIRAGSMAHLYFLPRSEDARQLSGHVQRVQFEICYCSVYDECWIARSSAQGANERVSACATTEEDYLFDAACGERDR
jgi:hypothetical protein